LFKRKSLNNELERRRKVKFSIVKTALLEDIPLASDMNEEEKNTLWWNKEELKETYESVYKLMRSYAKRPRNNNSTQAYHTVLYSILEACKDMDQELGALDSEDMSALADWHRNSLSKRGLEKLVLNSFESNSKIRATIAHATSLVHNNANIDETVKAESIRVCSERLTRPARAFARALGAVDAASVLTLQEGPRVRRAWELLF
jgi:hypothetical protein